MTAYLDFFITQQQSTIYFQDSPFFSLISHRTSDKVTSFPNGEKFF